MKASNSYIRFVSEKGRLKSQARFPKTKSIIISVGVK